MIRESWSGAAAYEAFIGRYSRQVAPLHLDQLDVPPDRRWLDVGCGTGALSATILERARPFALTGIDPSAAFLEAARASTGDPLATFIEGSALALPVADGSADAGVAGLVLNFVGDVPGALAEMRRALAPGGTVGAYVWDYAEGMELLRRFFDVAIAVAAPGAAEADEGARFPRAAPSDRADPAGRLDSADGARVVGPRRRVNRAARRLATGQVVAMLGTVAWH